MSKITCMADLFEPSRGEVNDRLMWFFYPPDHTPLEIQVMSVVRDALFDRGLDRDERRRVMHWLEEYVAANELL